MLVETVWGPPDQGSNAPGVDCICCKHCFLFWFLSREMLHWDAVRRKQRRFKCTLEELDKKDAGLPP